MIPKYIIKKDHALDPDKKKIPFDKIPHIEPIQLTITFNSKVSSLEWDFSMYENIDTFFIESGTFYMDDHFPLTLNILQCKFARVRTEFTDRFTVNKMIKPGIGVFQGTFKYAFKYVKIYNCSDIEDIKYMPYATRYYCGTAIQLDEFENLLDRYPYLVAAAVNVNNVDRFMDIYKKYLRLSPVQGTSTMALIKGNSLHKEVAALGNRQMFLLEMRAIEAKLHEERIPEDVIREIIGRLLYDKRYKINASKLNRALPIHWPMYKSNQFIEWVNTGTVSIFPMSHT